MLILAVVRTLEETMTWLHQHHIDTILGASAIVFAFVQYLDSQDQKRKIKDIGQSVSTQFIGQFPDNMPKIVDVVHQARKTLDILADVAAYGHYSTPSLFENYLRKIDGKRNLKKIRMLVYHPTIYTKLRLEQFPEKEYPEERKSDRYIQFFEANKDLERPDDWKSFQSILLAEQHKHLTALKHMNVEIRTLKINRQMSLWIEDCKEAVFSFQNPVDHEKEMSFHTRDGNLISTLTSAFEQAWAESEELNWSRES